MRRSIIGIALACLASIAMFAVRAADFIASGFAESARSAAAFVWTVLERATLSSPALAYVGPSSSHALRHEAGTSRRSAERRV